MKIFKGSEKCLLCHIYENNKDSKNVCTLQLRKKSRLKNRCCLSQFLKNMILYKYIIENTLKVIYQNVN